MIPISVQIVVRSNGMGVECTMTWEEPISPQIRHELAMNDVEKGDEELRWRSMVRVSSDRWIGLGEEN